MARGVVVIYFSWFGKPLQRHHKVVLDAGSKAIANIKGFDFGGCYDRAHDHAGPVFFVPDDTLLTAEASCLGIHSPQHLYGGVAPHLFVKTKAITHGLVDCHAERPWGWSTAFAERVRGIVLPGYTVFSKRDARLAAARMLRRGPFRLKKPLSASGKDQTLIATRGRQPPANAVVDFQGDDPEAGPLLRYTVVKPQSQRLPQLAQMLRMPELVQ